MTGATSNTTGRTSDAVFGSWGLISVAVHALLLGAILLWAPSAQQLDQPKKTTPVSPEKIEEVTEHIKDLQAEQLLARLDRVREIQAELQTIRNERRARFTQFAGAVGDIAPESAAQLQKDATAAMESGIKQIEALEADMKDIEAILAGLQATDTFEEREPLWTRLEEVLKAVRKKQDDLKLAQVESREAQETSSRRLQFSGQARQALDAQNAALAAQKEADAVLDSAATDRQAILSKITEVERSTRALEKARKDLRVGTSRETDAAQKLAAKRAEVERLEKEIAALNDASSAGSTAQELKRRTDQLERSKRSLAGLEKTFNDRLERTKSSEQALAEKDEASAAEIGALVEAFATLRQKQTGALRLQRAALAAQLRANEMLSKPRESQP